MHITFKPITPDNLRAVVKLAPAPGQEQHIEPNVYSFVESAYITAYKPLAIYADDTLVGFLMYYCEAGAGWYWLDRFMIDGQHQRKGYGRAALQAFLEMVKVFPDCNGVGLTFIPGNTVAEKLYTEAGFVRTGETDENGEIIMKLAVTRPADEGVRLHPIDRSNWGICGKLELEEHQRPFVASNLRSLAEAYFNPNLFPYGIYCGGQMVGFIMYGFEDFNGYKLWYISRLMVDKHHQSKGYGRRAMQLAIERIRTEYPETDGIAVGYVPENVWGARLYASLGFLNEGTMIGDEVLVRLPLKGG